MSWYLKRYVRVLRPYLLITIPFGIAGMLLFDESLLRVLSWISTMQYWISHQAAWFIALLLPLYAIAPWLYRRLRKNGLSKLIIIFCVCYGIALYPAGVSSTAFFGNVQFAIIRIPAFVLGMYMAPMIQKKKQLSYKPILISVMAAMLLMAITCKPLPSYFFLIIPVLKLLTDMLQMRIWCDRYSTMLCFFGTISLESYIFNTCLPKYIHLVMDNLKIPDFGNYIFYTLVLVIGTSLAVIANRLSYIVKIK